MIISVFLSILSIVIMIALNLFSIFSSALLERINVVNSIVSGLASGIILYLCNRSFDAFFSAQLSVGVCIGVGVAVIIAAYFIQKTKPGFWIFAVIFSLIWAFVSAMILYIFVTESNLWFWIVFILSAVLNMGSHLNSREI